MKLSRVWKSQVARQERRKRIINLNSSSFYKKIIFAIKANIYCKYTIIQVINKIVVQTISQQMFLAFQSFDKKRFSSLYILVEKKDISTYLLTQTNNFAYDDFRCQEKRRNTFCLHFLTEVLVYHIVHQKEKETYKRFVRLHWHEYMCVRYKLNRPYARSLVLRFTFLLTNIN